MDLQDKLRRIHKKDPSKSRQQKNLPDLSPFLGGEEIRGEEGAFWSVIKDFPGEVCHGMYKLGELLTLDLSSINLWEKRSKGGFDPRDLVFLDTETTGLAGGTGTVAFLVGLGFWKGDSFRLQQYIMRDFPEEPAMLQDLSELLEPKKILVTFNGRSFDWPLLQTRFTLSRKHREIPCWEEHWDLLFWARRLWRRKLSSCSLTSLERNILGFFREEDIPGWEIPQRYFDFLRTGRGEMLKDICEHNVWDILSMVSILLHLLRKDYQKAEKIECPREAIALGKIHAKNNSGGSPEEFYLQAVNKGSKNVREEALKNLALHYKKRRNWEKAREAWISLLKTQENSILARTELAKIYEHRLPDFPKALKMTMQALALAWNEGREKETAELDYRRKRLERKLNKKI